MTKPTGRPRGKPPLPPGAKRDTIVEVHVTPAELAEIDRRREQAAAAGTKPDSRSEWLITAAGVRPVAPAPTFTPVVRLDSTTGAWTVADGWIETEQPGVYTMPGFATIETGEPKDPKP